MTKREAYRIESKPVEERYARGWHCLGHAREYTERPQALSYFGTKLVAYRGEDGQVRILDGYCPHMGADLSLGCVEQNSIRCPFHGWRWGGDGVCDDIPYARRIPARAVINAWPTLEQNGLLFVWNDPEGGDPIPGQEPPRIDDYYSGEWSDWAIETIRIHANCRELVDNMADVAHFAPVHGAPVKTFRNIVHGHTYTQILTASSELLAEEGELYSEATYYGPAYMTTYMSGQMEGQRMESRLLVTHVPIDTHSFDLRFGVLVKKIPGMGEAETEAMVQGYVEQNRAAFFQDVQIWHTKIRVDNPLMCDGDGPVSRLRQWYQQFYQDVAEVGDQFSQRKEYESHYALRD